MTAILVVVGAVLVASAAAAGVGAVRRARRLKLGTAVVRFGEPFHLPVHAPGRRLVLDVSFTVDATGRRADEGTLLLETSSGVRIERSLGSTNDSASHTSDAGGYLRASTTFELGVAGAEPLVIAGTLRVVEDGFSGTFFVTLTGA